MISRLARALLRRRLRSPARTLLLLVLVGMDGSHALLSGAAAAPDPGLAAFGALIVAAGVLGQEWREGSLAVLLCRPLSRGQVALAAWTAGAAGGFGAWLAAGLVRLVLVATPWVDASGDGPAALLAAVCALASSVGLAAASLAFALAGRGLPGAGAHLALLLAVAGLIGGSAEAGPEWLGAAGRAAADVLLPVADASLWSRGDLVSLESLVAWSSNVALLACFSLWRLQRLQLSHASAE